MPPCAAARSDTSANPIPEPSWLREAAPATRLNRANSLRLMLGRDADAGVLDLQHGLAVQPIVAEAATVIPPEKVNFRAFDSRLSTIFAHISRSTSTGEGSGGAVDRQRRGRPARSRPLNVLASSVVYWARSTGSKRPVWSPASRREKSSRVLTSRSSRSPLRRTSSNRSPLDVVQGSPVSTSASSAGPSSSVSGVRNSWLTLVKNSVLARSSSSSRSARSRSSW